MKLILVGDTHVTKTNFEETEKLLNWVRKMKVDYKADAILFLGDQYDDFGIMRTDVMNFWIRQFMVHSRLDMALIGNHDEDAQGIHSAMEAHAHQLQVVGKEPVIIGNCAFVGYIRKNEDFITMANSLPANITHCFCHAEFDGAQFEGGFFTTHGIPLDQLPKHIRFVSGHIHKHSEFGNVFYPGTARWTIRSDANTAKGIWYYDTDTSFGEMIKTPPDIAVPYVKLTITPNMNLLDILQTVSMTNRTYLDFQGPQSFIDESYELLAKHKITDVKTRAFPDREGQVQVVSEAEGLNKAFYKYANHYCETMKLDTEMTDKILTQLQSIVGEL
jgi:hypothetical protein